MTKPNTIDYTSLDYGALRDELLRHFYGIAGRRVDDLSENAIHVGLLESMALVGEKLAYTENAHVRESNPLRAVRRPNFQKAAAPFGFQPKERSASTTQVQLTIDPTYNATNPIPVPATQRFLTKTGMVFQPVNAITFGTNYGSSAVVDVIQGEPVTDEVLASASPGTAFQSYALFADPVLIDTIVVTVGGIQWTRVLTLPLAKGTDRVFSITSDDEGRVRIYFGDGICGAIPALGQEIRSSYKIGGGIETRIAADEIVGMDPPILGVTALTNPEEASDGSDAEALEVAQARLPGASAIRAAVVTTADYAALAESVDGVLKATATKGPAGSGGCGCPMLIYVKPEGGGDPSPTLIAMIVQKAQQTGLPNKRVIVRGSDDVDLDLALNVRVLKTARVADTKQRVSSTIFDAYDELSQGFGATIELQDLYTDLEPSEVPGVGSVVVTRFSAKPYLARYLNSPTTGNGNTTRSVGYEESLRREWKLVCTSAGGPSGRARFSITPRIVGTVTSVQGNVVEDETLALDANLYVTGAGWRFVIGPYEAGSTTRNVLGNTSTSFSLSGNVSDYVQKGDSFVVEQYSPPEPIYGDCYRQQYTSAGTASGTVFPGDANWAVGVNVRLTTPTGITVQFFIIAGSAGAWTTSATIPAIANGVTVTAEALTILPGCGEVVIAQGSLRWGSGDTVYVDTFPNMEDLKLRPSQFPRIRPENLAVRTTGGNNT